MTRDRVVVALVACVVLGGLVAALCGTQRAVPIPGTIVPNVGTVGTFGYIHIDGALVMAFDTRNGGTKLCVVRPPENGAPPRVECR